jgi:hypothetical protein
VGEERRERRPVEMIIREGFYAGRGLRSDRASRIRVVSLKLRLRGCGKGFG